MMKIFKLNKYCRLCGEYINIDPLLTLGNQCISAFVNTEEIIPLEAPLELVLCPKCNLLQLKHTTNPDLLYNEGYGYRTGLNSTMIQEMKNIVEATLKRKLLEHGD